jgi:glycosyltransferase involved in cell wall biosynthesis
VKGNRIHTIPNARSPVSDLLDPQEARRRLGVPANAFHVGWIGRLSREKGPDVMIEALAELKRDDGVGDFRATFIGTGRERKALEARSTELGLDGNVRWAGELPAAARLIPGFDAVVLSSRTEGTPIVAIEALSAGVPLIATRVGGVMDLTGDDTAVLVPPEEPPALAAAIRGVRRDPEGAARRAGAGRARVEEVASVDRWVEAYLDLYRGVLSRPGGEA